METAAVRVSADERDGRWFGIAWAHDGFVATTVSFSRDGAIAGVARALRDGVVWIEDPPESPFVRNAADMLAAIERGDESCKEAVFSPTCLSGPQYRIHSVAASIPIGYVTTYGSIAAASGSEARAVGRAMATNPLYPLVPCHRVVGADFSLVGYGGRQDDKALKDKLARIGAEARGATREMSIQVPRSTLRVFPGEWVVNRAHELLAAEQQLSLF